MKPATGFLFDLGDTLLHTTSFDPQKGSARLLARSQSDNNVSLQQVQDYADRMIEEIHDRRISSQLEHSWRAFNRILYGKLGLELQMTEDDAELAFWKASVSHVPAPGVVEILRLLEERGLPMGVVSNTAFTENSLAWELAHYSMLDYFGFIVASADCGVRKPNPLIFELAAAKLGIEAADIWFIGNEVTADYMGSRSAGMTPILYTGKTGESPAECDNVIRHWDELPGLMDIS